MPDALRRSLTFSGIALLATVLVACGRQDEAAGGPPAAPPVEASVVTVQPQSVQRVTELPGRLEAIRAAEVRARVPGIVLERTFEQGSDVKEGDVLYRIDPSPLEAARHIAEANLQQAEASLFQARQLERRYAPLVESRAVSQQEYDQAVAGRRLAEAQVAQQTAALDAASLDLGYATVTAPISGRIGNALVTEGALVGQGEPTPLALIQQIDSVYANFTQAAGEALALQQALASGQLSDADGSTAVTLVLGNGKIYPHEGRMLSSGISVDPGTGQITLRAEFPNPDRMLLPGMYVRGRLVQGVQQNVLQVPSRAVQRNADGSAYVYVVDAQSQAQVRRVTTGPVQAGGWVIDQGLNPGDQVIIDRFQQIQPGATVKPMPAADDASPSTDEPSAAPSNAGDEPAAAPAAPGATP